MSDTDPEDLLTRIRGQIGVESETECEVLSELRAHLQEALADAEREGLQRSEALARVAAQFGLQETAQGLREAHAGWGTADGVLAAALPALCALILRWLVYAPDGTALGWPELLNRPSFWVVAVVMLLVPLLKFGRWRYAVAGWVIFWTLTVVFVAWPALHW